MFVILVTEEADLVTILAVMFYL